jgi:hypothetical protein
LSADGTNVRRQYDGGAVGSRQEFSLAFCSTEGGEALSRIDALYRRRNSSTVIGAMLNPSLHVEHDDAGMMLARGRLRLI